MKVRKLLDRWQALALPPEPVRRVELDLPLTDLARLQALNDLFPGRSREVMMAELLHAALDEVQEAFPYVHGERQVGEDEFGNPVYEDIGPTPRFLSLTQKHLTALGNH
ncbi:MAG: hypothetical protein ACK4UT_03295 [Moraxellaceae bacterium]